MHLNSTSQLRPTTGPVTISCMHLVKVIVAIQMSKVCQVITTVRIEIPRTITCLNIAMDCMHDGHIYN